MGVYNVRSIFVFKSFVTVYYILVKDLPIHNLNMSKSILPSTIKVPYLSFNTPYKVTRLIVFKKVFQDS